MPKSAKAFIVTAVVVIGIIALDKWTGASDKLLNAVGKKAA